MNPCQTAMDWSSSWGLDMRDFAPFAAPFAALPKSFEVPKVSGDLPLFAN